MYNPENQRIFSRLYSELVAYDCFGNALSSFYSDSYLNGEESFLNKGYGSKLIKIIVSEIKLKEGYKFLIADPDHRNVASIKVLEKTDLSSLIVDFTDLK